MEWPMMTRSYAAERHSSSARARSDVETTSYPALSSSICRVRSSVASYEIDKMRDMGFASSGWGWIIPLALKKARWSVHRGRRLQACLSAPIDIARDPDQHNE